MDFRLLLGETRKSKKLNVSGAKLLSLLEKPQEMNTRPSERVIVIKIVCLLTTLKSTDLERLSNEEGSNGDIINFLGKGK